MKLAYFSAVVFLALCSCSKKDSKRVLDAPPPVVTKPAAPTSSDDFKDKSKEEILAMKYDKITLKCELWTQYGSALDLTRTANDSFEVDFLNDPKLEKSVMSLKGNANGRDIVAELKLDKFMLSDVKLVNMKGDTLIAKSSPILHLIYKFEAAAVNVSAGSIAGPIKGSGSGMPLYENNLTDVLSQSAQMQDEESKYFDYLNCKTTAVLKEKYKDQFKIEPKAN